MIRICTQCGALLLEDVATCAFCDAHISESEANAEPEAVAPATPFRASVPKSTEENEPEWRREVARRLEQYRSRRGRPRTNDSQAGLPFLHDPEREAGPPERARLRSGQRHRHERVDIRIQSSLDFTSASDHPAHPQTALVPVATLAERRVAGVLDAFFLGLAYAGFLGLFRSLGGQLMLAKVDAAVYVAAFFLFYAQYFFLFTTFGGSTPGMQLRGLTIVRLDGTLPETRQLLWRSFGYVLSAATLMLGFLWSLWDEDHFTWQDRISQTYITAATPILDADAFDAPARSHRLAHR